MRTFARFLLLFDSLFVLNIFFVINILSLVLSESRDSTSIVITDMGNCRLGISKAYSFIFFSVKDIRFILISFEGRCIHFWICTNLAYAVRKDWVIIIIIFLFQFVLLLILVVKLFFEKILNYTSDWWLIILLFLQISNSSLIILWWKFIIWVATNLGERSTLTNLRRWLGIISVNLLIMSSIKVVIISVTCGIGRIYTS